MTVQELIERLEKVGDKSIEAVLYIGDKKVSPIGVSDILSVADERLCGSDDVRGKERKLVFAVKHSLYWRKVIEEREVVDAKE